MTSPDTLTFMELAIQQAKISLDALEVPVGCVIVEDGKVIASGRNRTTETRNATRHAEMEAIDVLLEQWQKNGLSMSEVAEKFSNCSLYVTCEPCIMCASALSILGIKEVFYGCCNDKFGGCGSILSLHLSNTKSLNNEVQPGRGFKCTGGIMASEAILLLRTFYEQGNPNGKLITSKASKAFRYCCYVVPVGHTAIAIMLLIDHDIWLRRFMDFKDRLREGTQEHKSSCLFIYCSSKASQATNTSGMKLSL